MVGPIFLKYWSKNWNIDKKTTYGSGALLKHLFRANQITLFQANRVQNQKLNQTAEPTFG